MGLSEKEMAPAVRTHPGTWPTANREREVTVDTQSIRTDSPEVLPDDRPHGCYDGWHYLGYEAEDESGELVEVIERVPCRRGRTAAGEAL